MKSKLLIIASIILLSIGFTACQDEEIKPATTTSDNPASGSAVEDGNF